MDESAVAMFVDFSVSIEFAVPSDWIVQWWTAWNLGIYYESHVQFLNVGSGEVCLVKIHFLWHESNSSYITVSATTLHTTAALDPSVEA
eukprot:scaffold7227_cov90-Skeletonema_marinoi.AAC.3